MKKLTKKQIKLIADIHCGLLLESADEIFHCDCNELISMDDWVDVLNEIKKTSERFLKDNRGVQSQTKKIIEYVLENY